MKQQRDGRKTRENRLLLGDYVLVKQPKKNKWSTPYEPVLYVVYSIQGSRITARRVTDGRTVCRDASQFKLANAMINTADEHETTEEAKPPPSVPEHERPGSRTPYNSEHERLGSRTPHNVPPNQKPANTETASTGNPEMPLEQAKPTPQHPSASSTPIVNQSPTTRPRRERHKPSYLKDYVLT